MNKYIEAVEKYLEYIVSDKLAQLDFLNDKRLHPLEREAHNNEYHRQSIKEANTRVIIRILKKVEERENESKG